MDDSSRPVVTTTVPPGAVILFSAALVATVMWWLLTRPSSVRSPFKRDVPAERFRRSSAPPHCGAYEPFAQPELVAPEPTPTDPAGAIDVHLDAGLAHTLVGPDDRAVDGYDRPIARWVSVDGRYHAEPLGESPIRFVSAPSAPGDRPGVYTGVGSLLRLVAPGVQLLGVAVAVVFRLPEPRPVAPGALRTIIAKRPTGDATGSSCVYTDSVSATRFLLHADSVIARVRGTRTTPVKKIVQYPLRRRVPRGVPIVLCYQWQQTGPDTRLTVVCDGELCERTIPDCLLRFAPDDTPVTLGGSLRGEVVFETLSAVVHEVRVYKSALSEAQLTGLHGQLRAKWM